MCSHRFCLLFVLMTFCLSLRGRVLVANGISTSLVPFVTQMTYHPVGTLSSPSALRLMLNTCSSFATSHNLILNADKTQIIQFSHTSEVLLTSFFFNSCHLQLTNSVKHLGHILHSSLSDDEDIVRVRKDLTHKANCMLHSFSYCSPYYSIKTKLFSSFCLSLYIWILFMVFFFPCIKIFRKYF